MLLSFKVDRHLKHIGATPSPPAWIVVKYPKKAWQPSGNCPSRVFFEAQTHPIISVCAIKDLKRRFLNLECNNRPKIRLQNAKAY